MSDNTIDQARSRIAEWIKDIKQTKLDKRSGDLQADAESLERAADLELIYDHFGWVRDMPAPKRRLGRRVNPKSREQFAKWVKQTYDWGSTSQLDRLKTAHELLPILSPAGAGIHPTGEWSLRPLAKLRAQGYGDHQTTVWQQAVAAADGQAPTVGQVTKAVNDFLQAHKPPIPNTAKDPRSTREIEAARRQKLVAEFEAILASDNRAAKELINECTRRFNAHQAVLRAEREEQSA